MLKSIITTAFRNIYRNQTFSLINLIGLSVSMSLSMLIILIVKEQYTYDNFHRDAERIHRVNTRAIRVDGRREEYASVPFPIGKALQDEYTFVEELVRINRRFQGDVTYGNVNVPAEGFFVDPSFLKVFNFPLAKGDSHSALSDPKGLVLSQKAAAKIFGSTEPLGQTLSVQGFGDFIVTGVLKEFESKTHLDFEMLGSVTALPNLEKSGAIRPTLEDWNNYYGSYVYIKLKEGKSVADVEAALTEIYKKYYSSLKLETRDKGYEFYVHSLKDITPGPELSNQLGQGMPTFFLLFLGTLAGLVLLMSVFNFTNLMIAKSLSRAREIGVRKVVGAQRYQVFSQFVGETVVFALLALVISYVLLQFLKTGYLQLPLNEEFSMDLKEDVSLIFIFIGFAISVGILAGILPASYLSAFRPAKVLKDAGNLKVYSKLTFRKVLMVAQFTFSVVFVVIVLVIYNQVEFMMSADYGIDQKNKINVRLQGLEYDKVVNEFRAISGVIDVGGVSHKLGTWSDRSSDYKKNRQDPPFSMRDFMVDDSYVNNIGLVFLAGRNFVEIDQTSVEREVILNEEALTSFGISNPVAAIGQTIYANDSVMLTVIGVIKDFHYRPLNSKIGPLALRFNTREINFMSIQIVPEQKEAVLAAVVSLWKRLDPIHPVNYMMMDEEIDDAYRQAGMHDILVIVGYIAFLTVTLACLGMLGMAMYATQIRVKEVGVRKVLGASAPDLVLLLTKSFMKLIGVAVILGVPISFFLGDLFLDLYAYKIAITPLLLGTGVLIIAGLGLLIICSQTLKTALGNPVNSLRYE